MLILSREDIVKALPMDEAVEAVKRAFRQFSTGGACVPERAHLETPKGVALVMPGYLRYDGALAVKVVSVFPQNPGRNLPVINAVVVVIDAETGVPVAVLDGTSLTAIRTGAASGAATDLLARPEASTAAVFGAGAQGRTQLTAICAVRALQEVRVYDTREDLCRRFVDEMSQVVSARLVVAKDPSEAVSGADIVCTVTTSNSPVFDDADLGAGTHINAVGVFQPDRHEIPPETVRRASVYVDSRSACREEAGDLLIPLKQGLITANHVLGEIGEVAAGIRPGRKSDDEITLFKSVGVAVQDAAAAAAVLSHAKNLGLGLEVNLG